MNFVQEQLKKARTFLKTNIKIIKTISYQLIGLHILP